MIVGTLQLQGAEGGAKGLCPTTGITGFGPAPARPARTGIIGSIGIELALKETTGQDQDLLADGGLQGLQIQLLGGLPTEQGLNVPIDFRAEFRGECGFFYPG